jgi:hypothetical protein
LHTWDLPHGGNALFEQCLECGCIVVAGIVQRGLGSHNVGGVEAGRQGFQVNEGSHQQSCGS